MTIQLRSELEFRLRAEARRRGMRAEEYIEKILSDQVPAEDAPLPDRATLDLLKKWDEEDATDDAAEIERRVKQWEEFRQSMNAHSIADRTVYP